MSLSALPNLISVARILLTPWILTDLAAGRCGRALTLCLLAGASDAADGFLARRLGVASRIGAYLDPIADKLLLTLLYLAFGFLEIVPMWLTVVVVGRDVVILLMAGAGLLFTTVREFPPSVLGKISTVIQVAAAAVFIASCADWASARSVRDWAVVAVLAGTAASGVQYVWRGLRLARSEQTFDAPDGRR